MSKILVLTEKPSVARDIGRVLRCSKKVNGHLEGDKYIVTWALGHLVTLAEPELYDNRYKSWKLEDIPMLPNKLKLIVIKQTAKQFNEVKLQMIRKDVNQIVIATDAGREGELVARWIIEKVNIKKPIKRLWISSVTDKAIIDGFNKLKDGREYENLYESAVARAEADWIVGINATRALTCKFNAQLSCGRVQTPTLAMIAEKENEIKNFKARTYYGITAVSSGIKLTWQDKKTNETRTFNKERREEIISSISGKEAIIVEVSKKVKSKLAPQLYDLTTLQRDANRIFDFSAKETLNIMQKLYETHKVLTYPRTDSKYISTDIVNTLKDRIEACRVGTNTKIAFKLLKSNIKVNKNFVDDSKVSDHHAIIPTEVPVILGNLNDRERKIYEMVVKRFLAVLHPPFEYEQLTVKAQIGDESFFAKGKRVIANGWKDVYDSLSEEVIDNESDLVDQLLPNISKGQVIKIDSISRTQGETKPPSPFNEGTLLEAMENPAKFMGNEKRDLIKTIGDVGGIGTVATRADIIEKLFNTFLIEKKNKHINLTSKGRQLLGLVPEGLKSPALTANWEQKLTAISKGTLNKSDFVDEMKNYTIKIVTEIKNSGKTYKHDNSTMNRCPDCGKFMLEVNGKKGRMLICQDRGCGSRKVVSRVSNARCLQCHKKLEMFGEGDGQVFICNCGYKEKLSAFKERKKKEGDRISKKDVNKYLKQQQEDGNINSALADALAKLKK